MLCYKEKNMSFTGISPSASTISTAVTSSQPKIDITHVIVLADQTTLELKEPATLSPKELIGLSKFFQAISYFTLSTMIGLEHEIRWSDLVSNLGLDRFFVPGLPVDQYTDNGPNLNIILFDPS
jgi:hypothetical protein